MAKRNASEAALASLREYGLAFPEAHEDHPWGETALKVKGKVFAFLSLHTGGLSMSTKLPQSNREALLLPFTEPTHYGLGKHGWVSATFAADREPPLAILRAWIDESYRAVAPKKLVATLDAPQAPPAKPGTKPAVKKAARKSSRAK